MPPCSSQTTTIAQYKNKGLQPLVLLNIETMQASSLQIQKKPIIHQISSNLAVKNRNCLGSYTNFIPLMRSLSEYK